MSDRSDQAEVQAASEYEPPAVEDLDAPGGAAVTPALAAPPSSY